MPMPLPKLLSIGELFDHTWETYHRRFFDFVSISSIILLSTFLTLIAISFWPDVSKTTELSQSIGSLTFVQTVAIVLFAVSNLLFAPFLGAWVFPSLISSANQNSKNENIIGTSLKIGLKNLLPTIWVSFLFFVLLLAVNLICFLPSILMFFVVQWTSVGFLGIFAALLLFLGGVTAFVLSAYLSIQLAFAPYLPTFNGTKGVAALKMSHELIKGRFWSLLLRIVIPKIVFLFIGLLISAIFSFGVGIFIQSISGFSIDIASRLSVMSSSFFPALVVVFINPLLIISDILILKNITGIIQGNRRPLL